MDFDDFLASKYPALFLVLINALIYMLDYKIKNYFGLILVFFGAFAYFYNLIVMGKFWSIKVEKKKGLVAGGFFKYIRHPLYLGCALACFGAIIMSYNLWLALLFVFADLPFIYLRSKYEEKILIKSLKSYKEYMKKTWMFIPKII
jgi:protein-S-isoprenylcysteine O-methyltransferase Ste14